MKTREEILSEHPIDAYLSRRGVELKGGVQATARCPFHEDKNASFSVNRQQGTWFCHAGCGGGSVIDLEMKFNGVDVKEAIQRLSPNDVPARPPQNVKRKEVAWYPYTDELGNLLYEVVRFDPKDFRQRHRGPNDEWVWSMEGVRRVLFNLPRLLNANVSHVWIVEGEKDVESLRKVGIVGTTNVGGAGKWMDAYSDSLKGKEIILCGDNDEAGRKHVAKVLASVSDKAKSVRQVSIPAPHKDVSDFIASFSNIDSAFNALCGLCENATVLTGGIALPVRSMAELELEYRQHVEQSKKNTLALGNWLPSLGARVRGIVPGELIAILGGTGVGKTAILQNLALNASPLPTLFFEMELPGSLTFERFIQIARKASGSSVYRGYNGGERIEWAHDTRLASIHVCTKSRLSTDELETIINKSELKIGVRPVLVVVDYAQLVQGRGNTRYERASDVSERLKVIAKETNTIIVFGSQIQRKGQDDSNEVYLHDGKESGSIENSSGLVLGAWRDDKDESLLNIRILKNTKGRPGDTIPCNFNGETLVITERSKFADVQFHNEN